MRQLTDIEIAQQTVLNPIVDIAHKIGISDDDVSLYGKYKAKIEKTVSDSLEKRGKLVLVTAMTPTPAGEGKTTTSVGLADALSFIGEKTALALREPSLGPVFGIKGGAAGGGHAQVVPMEDINLHFTGDFHAISSAHNLLAALIDNHIHHGNELGIDPRQIVWKRVVDMNDRQLRHIVSGLHGKINGVPREDGFDITVASEVMAVLCLSDNLRDLKDKLGKMIVGYTYTGEPVTAHDLQAEGAMAALLKDAIKPNLVQTLEKTPAFIHGGPFANIAHGCNSVIATKMALQHADYVVTEAGFGADLGAEKFLNIKCRLSGLKPDVAVLVGTIRALKMHGGVDKNDLNKENIPALMNGIPNLLRHLHALKDVYQLPVVVAINQFPTDTTAELEAITQACQEQGVEVVVSQVWEKGGRGGEALARKVVALAQESTQMEFVYDDHDTVVDKIKKIVTKVYGGQDIVLSARAKKDIEQLEKLGFGSYPICMAKTQYSFSDNPTLKGAPNGFDVHIKQLKICAGAGFIVALTGDMMTMPGLPKIPAAQQINIDEKGAISGLF